MWSVAWPAPEEASGQQPHPAEALAPGLFAHNPSAAFSDVLIGLQTRRTQTQACMQGVHLGMTLRKEYGRMKTQNFRNFPSQMSAPQVLTDSIALDAFRQNLPYFFWFSKSFSVGAYFRNTLGTKVS